MERIDKILSNMGIGTRKEVKKYIKFGEVSVNGQIICDPAFKADPEKDEIWAGDEKLSYVKDVYIMLNKPQGCVSATTDTRHKTVLDYVPDEYSHCNLFPAGRLDIDTEGFVLLTNDGAFAHDILSPKKHVPKKYFATLDREAEEEDFTAFEHGIILDDGYKTLPAKLEHEGDGYLVTIHEGKFHQIKRMFEARGKKVTYLKRIQMGNLVLDENLALGECKILTKEEAHKIWI